jgi:hypothetical protein
MQWPSTTVRWPVFKIKNGEKTLLASYEDLYRRFFIFWSGFIRDIINGRLYRFNTAGGETMGETMAGLHFSFWAVSFPFSFPFFFGAVSFFNQLNFTKISVDNNLK